MLRVLPTGLLVKRWPGPRSEQEVPVQRAGSKQWETIGSKQISFELKHGLYNTRNSVKSWNGLHSCTKFVMCQ